MKLADAAPLLGKEVKVTLAHDDPRGVVEGTLLSFADSGEVIVRDEMGFTHWCWPMLEVEAR